ncbi:hypothetical protein Agub_g11178 [Astrephomene gubernaculifera]|uniref:Uncharacterized protein n=1 Tax=Astrephomene gubernaculifera TaxID=47775 RepID=A0AAD3HQ94_9CHLO|nr:hypothetical protein Agub_g11178 [Astrephomene gubernaculifera]
MNIFIILLAFVIGGLCVSSSRQANTGEGPPHPVCDSHSTVNLIPPVAKSVTDVTPLLHGAGVPEGACIFNPALVRLSGDVYCLFARVYTASVPEKRCAPGHRDRAPFLDGWRGKSTNVMVALRLNQRNNSHTLQAEVLGHSYLGDSNLEDGRLFKDTRGRTFVYLALPVGVFPDRAVINSVYRVYSRCSRTSKRCILSLRFPRALTYTGSHNVMDKNWVPWNGTQFMSFSHFGTLGPQSIFNWVSYEEPKPHATFDMVTEDPLFRKLGQRYGSLLHLGGGTPAILEASRHSYLAVGHLKAHPGCFHPEMLPAWVDRGWFGQQVAERTQSRCSHLVQSSNDTTRTEVLKEAFKYRHGDQEGIHYPLEYAFFFYRFNASPPYSMTHISHGFMPYTWRSAADHQGILFPVGLERFGAEDYIISYGDEDQRSLLLRMSSAQVEAMLLPIQEMKRRLDEFMVCTLPCEGLGNCDV